MKRTLIDLTVRLKRTPGMQHTFPVRLASLFSLLLVPVALAQTKNACLDCHSALDAPLKVTAEEFAANIHAQKGLTCASCHGGDPTSDDNAMSPKAGFRGHIERKQIPELCGKCHSDAAYIRQYNPSLRTDQLSQYHTSVHGKKLAGGDSHVAVCTDCHGVHNIRPASDVRSSVNPLNIATTCSHCHADANYMKAYGIPTVQFAEYNKSVHHEAMAVRGDLSAPTCTTCHGNHGAAPPGVATVKNVCSTCHVYQSQLFEESPHKAAFEAAGLPGCVTCHSNHAITEPNDQMVGTGEHSICISCHAEGDAGFVAANGIHDHLRDLELRITRSKQILDRAAESGMEVGQAQLDLIQATDALTKARVAVHGFRPDRVEQEVAAGQAVTAKTYKAGTEALRERNYRRMGLSISLLVIGATLIGLRLWIREIER
jgi:predicted CXXCH cytochrome family protein